jgi:hypothetical protein
MGVRGGGELQNDRWGALRGRRGGGVLVRTHDEDGEDSDGDSDDDSDDDSDCDVDDITLEVERKGRDVRKKDCWRLRRESDCITLDQLAERWRLMKRECDVM